MMLRETVDQRTKGVRRPKPKKIDGIKRLKGRLGTKRKRGSDEKGKNRKGKINPK